MRPLGPPVLPTPVGLGFARVLGPTRGGVAGVGNSPPPLVFGGTSPRPLARGLAPPGPPLPTPVGLGFASVLGPTRGRVANVSDSFPLLKLWGAPPRPPAMGACAPLAPPFLPTPVGWGFARVLGPTRGGVANVGYSPPLLISWGDTPHGPPPWGLRPPGPPVFAHPRWLGVCQRFGPHSWRGG